MPRHEPPVAAAASRAARFALARPPAATIAEQEVINSLGWMIRMRWFAGAAVIAAAAFTARIWRLPVPEVDGYALALCIFAYNLLFQFALRKLGERGQASPEAGQWFARVQIAFDWAAMAILINLSGGIESPAIIFFLFHITIASLLLPHDKGFLYVTLAPAIVAAIAWLEVSGMLPHVAIVQPPRYRDSVYIAEVLAFFTCASYVTAYLAMSISRRVRRRELEISGLYQSVQATTSTLDLSDVLERLSEATATVLGCQGAAIRLLDRAGVQLVAAASFGLSDAYMDKGPLELARSAIDQETLSSGQVVLIDTATDPRLAYPRELREEGIRTMLIAPVIGRTGPIGVLRAYGGEHHKFSEDDHAFLAAVAAQGAIAIENAQAYERLAAMDRDKSMFVRTVTHELRSPIQVSQNLLTLLEQGYVGTLSPEQADLITRARRRMEFLQTLVNDLLDLAAGKAERPPLAERSTVVLPTVLRDVCGRFLDPAAAKGVVLELNVEDETLAVWGEPRDVDRVLNNLLSNAVRYTPAGSISVTLTTDGEWANLVVRDTGIGIPSQALPHLFEEFFRAPNARAVQERGTGLGLAIVKTLVERQYGTIEVESAEGQGTTFTVRLPLAPESAILALS
ncbi:MAG: ATP-binding protein [Bacteroidales bacterium]